ncbi:MAG: AMP-binding protein, partial [Streptosporangiaceae bacterium]
MTTQMVTSPTGSSLQRLAERSWERTAARSQLFYEDQNWTGIQLAERSRRLAGGLREAGLRPGERVVICMANCPEVSVSYHAVWRAGAVATPVLFLLSEPELRHVLSDSGAVLAITTPEFLPKVTAAAAGADGLRGIIVAPVVPEELVPEALVSGELVSGELDAGELVPGRLEFLSLADLEVAAPAGLIDSDPAALAASAWAATATSHDPASTTALLTLPLSHVYWLMVSVMSLH